MDRLVDWMCHDEEFWKQIGIIKLYIQAKWLKGMIMQGNIKLSSMKLVALVSQSYHLCTAYNSKHKE